MRKRVSKKLFLPGELPAEFFARLERAFEQYRPIHGSDAEAVAESVRAGWFWLRHSRAREAFETKLDRRKPMLADRTEAEVQELRKLRHHEDRAYKKFSLAQAKIADIEKADAADENVCRQLYKLFAGLFDLEGYPYDIGS